NVVSLTKGVGSAVVTLNRADTVALTALYNGVLGVSGNILVSSNSPPATPGKAVTFQVSPPAGETAGSPFSVTVTAKDDFGNTVTGFNGSVTLYAGDTQKVGGSPVLTLTNGVGATQIDLKIAHQLTLTAVGGGISGVSGLTTVFPAAASTVQVFAPAVVQAGA